MDSIEVPEVVVLRLPLYVRALTQLLDEGTEVVSSQQLGSLSTTTSGTSIESIKHPQRRRGRLLPHLWQVNLSTHAVCVSRMLRLEAFAVYPSTPAFLGIGCNFQNRCSCGLTVVM